MQAINSISKRFFSQIPAQHVQWGIYAICILTVASASYALWMLVSNKFYLRSEPESHQSSTVARPTGPTLVLKEIAPVKNVITETSVGIIADIWRKICEYLDPADIQRLSTACTSLIGLCKDPYVQLMMVGCQFDYFARQMSWNEGIPHDMQVMGRSTKFFVKWNNSPAIIVDNMGTRICDLVQSASIICAQWMNKKDTLLLTANTDRTITLWERNSGANLKTFTCKGDIIDFWFDRVFKQIYVVIVADPQNDPLTLSNSLDSLQKWVGRNLERIDLSRYDFSRF